MDVSKAKVDADARNTFNQPASGNSSSSSSGNNSPDLPSRTSRSGRLQTLSKFSKAVTKGTTSSTITEAASTMLNVAQNENDKPSISTTKASSNEEEPQEISGRVS